MTWASELAGLPTDRVVQLRGAQAADIATWMAQAPADTPAALTHVVRGAVSATAVVRGATSATAVVGAILDDLETVAVELFPAWLPEAEGIHTAGGAGLAAVRALATDRAAHSSHFGPFLSDLAALALSGRRRPAYRYPPGVRAIGLARVVAESLGRHRLVLLIDVASPPDTATEQALVAGCEWLANTGKLGIWLTGEPLASVDWLVGATISPLTPPSRPLPPPPRPTDPTDRVGFGRPHPRSMIEAAVESALSRHEWAAERAWNQTYQSHSLTNPVRLDLVWWAERCVVELDGPEHRQPVQFDSDRQRDVQLQLDGYAVLRFTNARVEHDVDAVVRQIGTFLQVRRNETLGRTA
jgi:very-short-patch-repair endonuclease